MRSSPARSRLATILIGIFLVQTLLRLVLMILLYGLGYSTPAMHLLTLIVVFAVCGSVLATWGNRRAVRWLVGLVAATLWAMLTIFDGDALIASRYQFRPFSLGYLINYYCGRESWIDCVARYPTVVFSTFGVLALVIAAVTVLLTMCIDDIGQRALSAFRWFDRLTRRVLKVGASRALQAICFVYALIWLADPAYMARRDPVASLLYVLPFEEGPPELASRERPLFHVRSSSDVRPRTLVLITVDSLRADAIGLDPAKPTLTPFLRSLATTGKLLDLGPAVAVCASSYCGISAIQSGSGWATFQRGPPLVLADVLAANGYQNHFLLTGLHEMANLRGIYGPNVTTFQSDSDPDSAMRIDDREQIRRLARLTIADPARTYLAIHLMSAHAVGLRFENRGGEPPDLATLSNRAAAYRKHYAAGVSQADRVIERLFGLLKAKGLLDDALVVVTADHGERIGVPGKQGHSGDFDRWSSAIPLLVYDSREVLWPAFPLPSQTDIAPTLLDAVGITVPPAWEGQSLLRRPRRVAAPVDSTTATGMVAIVAGRKLLFRCALETGETRVEPFAGGSLSETAKSAALRSAPALHATLAKRKDGGRCFSRT